MQLVVEMYTYECMYICISYVCVCFCVCVWEEEACPGIRGLLCGNIDLFCAIIGLFRGKTGIFRGKILRQNEAPFGVAVFAGCFAEVQISFAAL